MNKRTLSQSEYGMWMNEQAFPGEAVNTIGFRLYLPEHEAGEVCEAADWVIKETALFHLQLVTEDNEVYLSENPQKDSHCILGKTVTLEEANALWDSEQKRSLAPAETKVLLRPVQEGGSFLIALFHHLVIDGHSLCQIGQMILDRISGDRTSRNAIRYDEFIGKDPGDELSDAEKKEHKDFWISYFAGVNAEPSLYSGSPEGCALEGYDYELSKVESLRIADYAKLIGTTESAVLGAALSIYLSRAARTKDAIFLMPRLNRDTPELRAAVGCRTLVVPVRNEIRQDMTFSDLCRQSMEKARSAAQHKRYGMGNILNDLHEAGIIAGALSEYVLNYHAGHPESEIPFDFMIGNGGAMHNHLTISVSRFGDTLQFHYDARVGIYTEESVRFFHEALLNILTQAMQGNPVIGDIEIVGDEEKKLLLCLRGKQIQVSETDSIPDLFRRAVEKNPDSPALYAGDTAYTFRELDAVSNRIANALIKRGVRQGEPVMYKLRRTHRLIAAMLGISKAGAAFIPIDPDYPADRINYIQEDSGAAYMITQDEFLKESARPGLVLLDVDELLSETDESDPKLTIPQDQLAYSIYTSGTTGKPKGVMLTHKGIVNITNPDNNPFNRDIITCGRGIVAIGSVCFDISLFEFFVPLFNGMFIEFAPENALADSRAIADLIGRHGANMLHLTPSRLSVYLQERNFSTAIAGVEVVLAAGEVLPGSLVDRLKNDYGIRIYNGYGPTETTIGATITKAGDNISIGKPIANTGILILDDEGRLLPFGMAGEICIYGNGVGLGYRNRPEETKKRFSEALGFRIYKTGDLGRFLPDGRILYLGRNDFQVKLRGLRIELSEIENCMLTYPQVASAVVQVRKIAGSEHLVGFYTVNEGEKADPGDLKEHLKRHLTLYMVPDVLKELDRLPQTPGGKTDLKAVEAIPVEYVRNYRAPETDLQKAVCDAFGAVLGDEKIGLDDNFFELGGDSLHTAELVMEIEKRLPDVNVKYEDIFRNPVPELLAQHLYRDGSGNEEEDVLKDLDYSGIRELLSHNTIGEKDRIEQEKLGNILLTGA
ncbi:MAG: amino acid adenylation domain-containing protein, partial [Lachnospiraceae bacterium]|nr:amino acid adenylation domain-containing protein [Lachnospiraceae bacterium]